MVSIMLSSHILICKKKHYVAINYIGGISHIGKEEEKGKLAKEWNMHSILYIKLQILGGLLKGEDVLPRIHWNHIGLW